MGIERRWKKGHLSFFFLFEMEDIREFHMLRERI